ncbi:MAG: SH3 domain-containing protein [Anaerolineae bacterium]|nr:SH3 domain-containing protein [Anaerolineae bacterium]
MSMRLTRLLVLIGLCLLPVVALAQQEKATVNPALAILIVRSQPDAAAAPTEGLTGGVAVRLTGEEVTVEGVIWRQIQPPSGTLGWVPDSQEGVATLVLSDEAPQLTNDTVVAPVAAPLASSGERTVAVDLLIVYSEPDAASAPVEAIARDVQVSIIDKNEPSTGERWLQIQTPSGTLGWVPEILDGVITLVNAATNGALAIGSQAVIFGTNLPVVLYTEAALDSQPLEAIVSGVPVVLTDGPVEVNNVRWWEVRSPSGAVGWVQETVDGQVVLIAPDALPTPTPIPTAVPQATAAPAVPTTLGVGVEVQILSLDPAFPLHAAPSNTSQTLTTLPRSTQASIIGGPVQVDETSTTGNDAPEQFVWWQIRTADGTEGWIQEAYYGEPILRIFDPANPVNPVICVLNTLRDVNIRSGPGTQFEQIASRKGAGNLLAADGQFGNISDPGNHWWRLAEGFWIRNDLVSEQTRESCAALPIVTQ